MRKKSKLILSLVGVALVTLSVGMVSPAVAQEEKLTREHSWREASNTNGPISTLNPLSPTTRATTQGLIWDRLAATDSITGETVGIIADNWRWINDTTFEINLRPEAHFRKGQDITADDVIYTFRAENYFDAGALNLNWVKSLEAADKLTVRINVKDEFARTKKVYGPMTNGDVGIIYKGKYKDIFGTKGNWKEDVLDYTNLEADKVNESGPYTYYYDDEQKGILKRVDDYWGNQIGWYFLPKYERKDLYGAYDPCVRAAESQQMDYTFQWGQTEKWLEDRSDFLGWWNPAGDGAEIFRKDGWYPTLVPNYKKHELFRKRWFRKALIHAIDYQKIYEAAFNGLAQDISPAFMHKQNGPIATDVINETYEATTQRFGITVPKYDPELAKEILSRHLEGNAKDGWKYKGEKVGPYELNIPSGWSTEVTAGQVLERNWEQIGITADLAGNNMSVWMEKYSAYNFDFSIKWNPGMLTGITPVAGTYEPAFVDKFAGAWAGSPMNYPEFWSGKYDSFENTYGEVKSLVNKLYTVPKGSQEWKQTVLDIQEIVIPQVTMIPLFRKARGEFWVTSYWVNWPYKQDPHGYPGWNWRMMLNNYPAGVETTNFEIATGTVQTGESFDVEVTLKNNKSVDLPYEIHIRKGEPQTDPIRQWHQPLGEKRVTVPANSSKSFTIPVTIDEAGTFKLNVDEWRIDQWDPGDPLTTTVNVKEVTAGQALENMKNVLGAAKEAIRSARSAEEAANEAGNQASEAVSQAKEAKEIAKEARNYAKNAAEKESGASTTMVIASMIVTIVVVLVGVYFITSKMQE